MQTLRLRPLLAILLAVAMLVPISTFAASHREAPITALDRTADITDWYVFVSFNRPDPVTMILNVDPLLEPSNGPNFFPFDPNVLYEMKIDNDQDGVEDVVFQFRFQTEYRAPGVFTAPWGHCRNSSDHIAGWRRLGRAQPATNLYRDDAQERCSH